MPRPVNTQNNETTDDIYLFAKDFKAKYGYLPTLRQIADEFGVVVSVVHHHVSKLRRTGKLDFADKRHSVRRQAFRFMDDCIQQGNPLPEVDELSYLYDIHPKSAYRYLRDWKKEHETKSRMVR